MPIIKFPTAAEARESVTNPKVETQEATPKNPGTIEDRIIALHKAGKTINEIASIVHVEEAKVLGVVGALKVLTFWDKTVDVVSNNWFLMGLSYVTSLVAAVLIKKVAVVNVVTGAKGIVVMATWTNFLLYFVMVTGLLFTGYFLAKALFAQ